MAVKFTESGSWNYQDRTRENAAAADVTLAFACDFSTAGERLTRRCALEAGKPYVDIQLPSDREALRSWDFAIESADRILSHLQYSRESMSINVAGNGLYTLPDTLSQEDVDVLLTKVLMLLDNAVSLTHVRSGGQTGIDEAGVKAAEALGIPAQVHAPKGWRMRTRGEHGRYADVSGERIFKSRFDSLQHLEDLALIRDQLSCIDIMDSNTKSILLGGTPLEGTFRYDGPEGRAVLEGALEVSESSAGKERLWLGDDLFSDALSEALQKQEKCEGESSGHQVYQVYGCIIDNMYDESRSSKVTVLAETVDEAERKAQGEVCMDDEFVGDIMALSIVIDGFGYDLDKGDRFSQAMSGRYDDILKETPDFVNVWYGTGENADLSNFASRPFVTEVEEGRWVEFRNVEQGFQYMKTMPQFSRMSDKDRKYFQDKILSTSNGFELRKIGREIPGLNHHEWNEAKRTVMCVMITDSFAQNPAASSKLLSFGDIRFSHLQDKSEWNYLFPVALENARLTLQRRDYSKELYSRLAEGQEYLKQNQSMSRNKR